MRRRACTVWFDDENGDVTDVQWAQHFTSQSPLMRADVLQAAGHAVVDAYEFAKIEAFPGARDVRLVVAQPGRVQ